jgi:lysophospholipase D
MRHLSTYASSLDNPTRILVVCFFVPLFWPVLFFIWPGLFFFIVSNRALRDPMGLHTNKNLLRDMSLFRRVNAPMRSMSSPIRRSTLRKKPLIIAHRCGGGEAPENTVAAARQSLENSPSLILHVDLLLTADKQVVCFHDQEPHERNMLKMTGRDSSISFFEFGNLPPLLSKIPTNPLCDLGSYIDTTKFTRDGRKICKFEDLCEAFIDVPMVLELWGDDLTLVERVHEILFSFRRAKNVVWGNRFSVKIQRACEDYDHVIPTFSTASQWSWLYIAYYTGVLPFLPIQHFDVFNAVLINEAKWRQLLIGSLGQNMMSDVVVLVFNVVQRTINWLLRAPGLFEHLQARGIPVVAFVVNDEEEWGYACSKNMAAICTDYPARFNSFSKAAPMVSSPSSQQDISTSSAKPPPQERQRSHTSFGEYRNGRL